MSNYELLCILSGKIAETEVSSFEKTIEDAIKNSASTVHFTHHLDRKKLAYPIDGHTYGYYFLTEFEAEPDAVATIKRELSLMNSLLRHSIAMKKSVGKPPIFERKQAFDALPAMSDMPADIQSEQPAVPTLQTQATLRAAVAPLQPKVVETVETSETPSETLPPSIEESDASGEKAVEQETPAPVIKDKKKMAKLSYEELDKKLDEIINNDIF